MGGCCGTGCKPVPQLSQAPWISGLQGLFAMLTKLPLSATAVLLTAAALMAACGCCRTAFLNDFSFRLHYRNGGLVGKEYTLTQDVDLVREGYRMPVVMLPVDARGKRQTNDDPSRPWGCWGLSNLARWNSEKAVIVRIAAGARFRITRIVSGWPAHNPAACYVQGRFQEGADVRGVVDLSQLIEDAESPNREWESFPVVAKPAYARPIVPERIGPSAQELLGALRSHKHWAVRQHAALELPKVASPETTDSILAALLAALDDPDAEVRYAAVDALGGLGPRAAGAAQTLAHLMRREDEAVGLCRRAAAALARIQPPVSPILLAAVLDREWPSRYVAAEGLATLGPEARPAIPALIDLICSYHLGSAIYETPLFAGRAIYRIDPEAGPRAVLALLEDPDEDVRCNAARALGAMAPGAPEAIPPLLDLAQRARAMERVHAIRALGLYGEQALCAVPTMLAALDDSNDLVGVREAAATALGNIGPAAAAAAAPALAAQLRQDYRYVHGTALDALAEMGPAASAAIPAVEWYLIHGDPELRDKAHKTLRALRKRIRRRSFHGPQLLSCSSGE